MRKYKRAIVTGASTGIGECFARQLASEGVNLILVARRIELLQKLQLELRQKFNVEVDILPVDLTADDAPEKLIQAATLYGKTVDLLINNAGNGAYRPFLKTPLNEHLQTIELNLVSLTRLCHLFGNHMLTHGQPSSIINVSSVASYQPIPKFAVYCGSKCFVRVFSEIFHYEMKKTNVSVTCLCPGGTATDFLTTNNQKMKTSLSVLQSAEEVAATGLKAAKRGKRVVVPGLLNKFQAFLPRLLPNFINLQIAKIGMELAIDEKN